MKKNLLILVFVVLVGVLVGVVYRNSLTAGLDKQDNGVVDEVIDETPSEVGMANPASEFCVENGGELDIVTGYDGSQIGMCRLENYACEEWALMNGECDVEADEELIKQALTDKGLDLTDMKVEIYKHLGKYIEGGVVPVSAPAGGGYVFAVKDGSGIKVVADGNGAIMCSGLAEYPDFPAFLISECVDEAGEVVVR